MHNQLWHNCMSQLPVGEIHLAGGTRPKNVMVVLWVLIGKIR